MTRDDRRRHIIAAARDVFLRLGSSARVRDIADEADVNAALLYQHFGSKEELFAAAVLLPLDDVVQHLVDRAGALPSDPDGDVQLAATKIYVGELLDALRESASLLGLVLFSDRDAGRSLYLERLRPAIDVVVDVVRNNLSTWSHRPFDPYVVTTATFGMCWAVAIDSVFTGREIATDEVAAQLTEMIFFGLAAPAGVPVASSADGAPAQRP